MSSKAPFYCIVDDTPLTTNLDEIEPWIKSGAVALIVPLYTLERLHLLKKDASQIGQNARKAVKFLDLLTSTVDLPHDPIIIQGPDDRYPTWAAVEACYASTVSQRQETGTDHETDIALASTSSSAKALHCYPEKLVSGLTIVPRDTKSSPLSTPPLSPSGSEPQSNKTSPEVRCATVTKHEATPVPPALKPLLNFVVWYSYESLKAEDKNLVFLTNSADAAQIAKDFGVVPKTIHQLRASIATTLQQAPVVEIHKPKKKSSSRKSSFKNDAEPRTLFSYDEVSSEDEELVFKPRPRDPPRPMSAGRGGNNGSLRATVSTHSPSNSIAANVSTPKPQVPVEEIDPDSFDRGTFARGSIPLANVGNHYGPLPNGSNGRGQRSFSSPVPRGGYRGNGFRGRGRGRLFVP